MNIYLSLALCFLPFILSLIFFKLFAKMKFSLELIASLLGLCAVIPISFVQFLLIYYFPSLSNNSISLLPLLLKTLILNGLLEEILKTLFVIPLSSKKIEFRHFFLASLIFGLSLGCFENSIYFLRHLQSSKANNGIFLYHLIFIRMFSSVLIHTFCTSLCAFFVRSVKEKQTDFTALLAAIFLHTLYDFFASFQSWIQFFSIAAILLSIIECRIHYEKNKPLSDYKKSPLPEKSSSDITIESALKDAPSND